MEAPFLFTVIIPFCEAAGAGVFLVAVGVLICSIIGIDIKIGAAAGLIITLYLWYRLTRHWIEDFEIWHGLMDEEYRPKVFRVELVTGADQYVEGAYIDLPATQEQIESLADGLLAGKRFSVDVWCGPHKPFKREAFEALRSEMERRGLAKWKVPGSNAQGMVLTETGRAVLQKMVEGTPLPDTDE